MVSFNRDDKRAGGFRGGFSRGGRSSFGAPHSFDRGGDRGNRPMFDAVCSNCGKPCQVPFRPTNGKPVYCSDCFEKMGGRSDSGSGRPERSSFRPQSSGFDQNKQTLDSINVKLDKILNLLQPKPVETKVAAKAEPKAETPVFVAPIEKVDMKEVMKEVKLPKVKPVSAKATAVEEKKSKKAASDKKK